MVKDTETIDANVTEAEISFVATLFMLADPAAPPRITFTREPFPLGGHLRIEDESPVPGRRAVTVQEGCRFIVEQAIHEGYALEVVN